MLRVRLLLVSRLGPERPAHTRLLRRRMTSPIRYAHPNILNKAVASHVLSTHQSTHFVQKRHENNHLVRFKSGKVWLSGVVADTQAKADHTLATKLGVDPTWVGTYVGRRYYRRKDKLHTTPPHSCTYPPLEEPTDDRTPQPSRLVEALLQHADQHADLSRYYSRSTNP